MGLRVCHHLRAHTHTHTYSKELHINSVQQQQQSSPAATCLPSSAINHWIPSALRCELEEWGEEGVEGSIPELDVVIPLMLCKWRMCLNPRCPTQLLLMLLLFSKPDRFQEPGRKKKHMPGWQDRWTVMGFVRFVKHTLRAARHKCQPCVKQHQCDTWAVPPVHQSSNQLWCNLSIASLINCDKSASCDLDWQLTDFYRWVICQSLVCLYALVLSCWSWSWNMVCFVLFKTLVNTLTISWNISGLISSTSEDLPRRPPALYANFIIFYE